MPNTLWRLTVCGMLLQALTSFAMADDGEPIRVFLIQNKSATKSVSFEIRERSETQWRKHVLEPQKAYFYEEKVNALRLTATSEDVQSVEPGFLFELHPNPKSDGWNVVRRSLVDRAKVSPTSEPAAAANTLNDEVQVVLNPPERGIELSLTASVRGEATAVLSVPLRGKVAEQLELEASCEWDLALVETTLTPARVLVSRDTTARFECAVRNIPCSGELTGRLVLRRGARSDPLVIPIRAQVKKADVELRQLSDDHLVVLSWPTGASVWLTRFATSVAQGDRRFVGTTPFVARVPDGTYRVELTHADARAEGLWTGPQGRSFSVIDQDRNARWWSVEVTKTSGQPALVRALWLRPMGTPLEQLTATAGAAPTLFDIGPADVFDNTVGIVFGRCGVKLTKEELLRLKQVTQRTGFLRYELPKGQTALELDFAHPVADQKFQAHLVRVGDSRLEIPVSSSNPQAPKSSQQ